MGWGVSHLPPTLTPLPISFVIFYCSAWLRLKLITKMPLHTCCSDLHPSFFQTKVWKLYRRKYGYSLEFDPHSNNWVRQYVVGVDVTPTLTPNHLYNLRFFIVQLGLGLS